MKKFSVLLALVCAMVLVLSSVSAADVKKGISPDSNYEIKKGDIEGDKLDLTFTFDETSCWNDWCPIAVRVTKDGSDYYYVIAGKEVGWGVSVVYEEIDGALVGSAINPDGENDDDLQGEWIKCGLGESTTLNLDFSDCSDWSVRVLCIAWCADNSCTVEDPDGTNKDMTYGEDNTPTDHVFTLSYSGAVNEDIDAPVAPATEAPAKTADAMNVIMIAGVAVIALAGVIVAANKKNA